VPRHSGSALIEKVDPNKKLRRAADSSESYISRMIKEAAGRFFDDERAQCAEYVKNAGNKAIHDLHEFQATYQKRMGEILDNTRKIVIDLYT
jgi:hypothetical protein